MLGSLNLMVFVLLVLLDVLLVPQLTTVLPALFLLNLQEIAALATVSMDITSPLFQIDIAVAAQLIAHLVNQLQFALPVQLISHFFKEHAPVHQEITLTIWDNVFLVLLDVQVAIHQLVANHAIFPFCNKEIPVLIDVLLPIIKQVSFA